MLSHNTTKHTIIKRKADEEEKQIFPKPKSTPWEDFCCHPRPSLCLLFRVVDQMQ
jgi:hypothetical protein